LSLMGTAVAIVCSIVAMMRNSRNDNREEAQQQGGILVELGYIKSGIDDIKAEQREQRQINQDVSNRLSAVEVKADRAHSRIDRWEHIRQERHEDK